MSVSPPTSQSAEVRSSQPPLRTSTPTTASSTKTAMPKTPTHAAPGLSSPPLTRQMPAMGAPPRRTSRSRSRSNSHEDVKAPTVPGLQAALQEARMTAAHYKLQYQMSQIESVEAIHRMSVENDMYQAEQQVLQRNERHRQQQQQQRQSSPKGLAQDANFRLVHVDVYEAMAREIDDLRSENARLVEVQADIEAEHEMTVASLRDRISLMQDGIRESAIHIQRYRTEIRSRANKLAHSAIQSPSARRLKAIMSTPSAQRPQHAQQAGFDALLQAAETSRPLHPAVAASLPATPQARSFQTATGPEYTTPKVQRQSISHLQAPYTAPIARVARKRSFDDLKGQQEADQSDGTISANESEAETEVANEHDYQARSPKRPNLGAYEAGQRSPDGRIMGSFRPMVQSRIYAPIRKVPKHARNKSIND